MRSKTAARATSPRSRHRAALAFDQYVSGVRGAGGPGIVFFLEQGDHVEEVRRIARSSDVVIAPEEAMPLSADRRMVGYRGVFIRSGDEMTLDGSPAFALQDYLGVPAGPLAGPTVVRQASAAGVAAFLDDADSARRSGIFADHLLGSAVLLDSVASFVRAGSGTDALVRVHATVDGEYRDGPDGLVLGSVGDGRAQIEARAADGAGRGRAFAGIVDRRVLEADLDDRPWLHRYVAALDLLRHGDAAPAHPVISGFGGDSE